VHTLICVYTFAMSQVAPRIVDRFPGYRERILRKCFQDVAVAELCRDYDTLIEALETAESSQDSASDVHQELLELVNALEQELMDRLGAGPGKGSCVVN
jgi:hypothetical protein